MIQSFPGDIVQSNEDGENGIYSELTVVSVGKDDIIVVTDGAREWPISWYTVFMRKPGKKSFRFLNNNKQVTKRERRRTQ